MIVTFGNQPAGEDGAAIYDVSVDGILTHQFTLDEQGSHDVHHHSTGEIVVCGTDATNDWSLGNIYVQDGAGWRKKRTLPNAMHVWGACEHEGILYVGTGSHAGDNATWMGQVFWSDDFGDTWLGHADVNSYRIYDLISFGGKLYAQGQPLSMDQALYMSEDDGVTWQIVNGVVPRPRHRLFTFGGNLMIVDNGLSKFTVVNLAGVISEISPPLPIANSFNVVAVIGDNMYVLCGAGEDKIYRYDGAAWHYHCDLGERCVSLLNCENEFLIASTIGLDAKILKISAG